MSFDPWADKNVLPKELAIGNSTGFEDNFFCPLPDSEQYVALLERKLAKLGKSKSTENEQLLEGLEERKTDAVVRLLTESTHSLTDYFSDEDIPTKWLRNYLNPEQPITVGELLSLVKEDYLGKASEDNETKGNKLKMTEIWGKKTFCLITGGSQGIGREIAKQFAEKLLPGSTMLLSARSVEGLKGTSSIIGQVAPQINVEIFPYDMSKPKEQDFMNILLKFASNEYDIYMLVHNAGSEGSTYPIRECSDPEQWSSYMTINLHSMAALTSSFLKVFQHDDRTVIINITSLAAIQVLAGLGEYGVGKAAREMYMKVLSAESPVLRVLSYSPGPVDTAMVERIIDKLSNIDTKSSFVKMRDDVKLLKSDQTVKKLVDVVSAGLPSYSRVDYYDHN